MTAADQLAQAQADKATADAAEAATKQAKAAREEAEAASDEAVALRLAERAKGIAEADKIRQEAEEAVSDLARQKREAASRQAIAEAEQKAREAAVVVDPALVRQQKEAEARKVAAQADKETAAAEQGKVAALIPDFSKVTIPETKLVGDQNLHSSILAHAALDEAALMLLTALSAILPNGPADLVLITSDEDLATSDAAYVEISTNLDHLIESADSLLPPPARGIAIAPIVAAAAGAIPGLWSLLAPRQTVSARTLSVDTTAAIAAVAGRLVGGVPGAGDPALTGRRVRIDDFRLVPQGTIATRVASLRGKRDALAGYKADQAQLKVDREAERDQRRAALDAAKAAAAADPPTATADDVAAAQTLVNQAVANAAAATVQVGLVDELLKVVDAFLVAVYNVPTGSKRSVFASAALHEELRGVDGAQPVVTTVLLVKATSGSIDQVYKDRPVRSDKYEGLASVSISYVAIDTVSSNVRGAGVALGSAQLRGEIGGSVKITPFPPSTG